MLADVQTLTGKLLMLFGPIALPLTRDNIWDNRSKEFKEEGFKAHYGISIDQFAQEKGGEGAWERLEGPLKEIAELLKRNDGPYVLGHEGKSSRCLLAMSKASQS